MNISCLYLYEEPSPDVLVTLDYPQYCLRIDRFNRELHSYNSESDLWLERACLLSDNAVELARLIQLIPNRFIALRKCLNLRCSLLKRREVQTRWIQTTRGALKETSKLGWWHWFYDKHYRDAQLIDRFLNNPDDSALRACLQRYHPNFLARWDSGIQAIPPFSLSPSDFHAPSVHPLSRKHFQSLKAVKRS